MSTVSSEDIRLIVQAAQNGDDEAFELLVRIYEKKTYAMARGLAGNDSDAQDMTQEAFVKLYTNLKSFHWESSFNTWFYRLVHNAAIDFIRKRKRRETASLDEPYQSGDGEMQIDVADTGVTPSEQAEKEELSRIVARSLQQLSEEQRTILVMRDMQDASYEEIAERLACPIGTVKSRIFRARAALKDKVLAQQEQYSGHLRLLASKGGGK